MIFLSKADFLKLPAGTIYKSTEYETAGLKQKQKTIYDDSQEPIDWFYVDLNDVGSIREHEDPVYSPGNTRDGRFCDDDLFFVFEAQDVEKLISILQEAIAL